jgi:ERF superfamily
MSTTNNQTIHAKLNQARAAFHAQKHEKSGENKYANYFYFELSDFLPAALQAFEDAGLCAIITFGAEEARMKIVDVETGTTEVITTPMSTAALKGCHPVQNLGAVQTYLRRYLWSAAIELVEADKVDAGQPNDESSRPPLSKPKYPTGSQGGSAGDETLSKDKFIAKKFPQKKGNGEPAAKPGGWIGRISEVKTVEGSSAKGPWKLFWVEMENGDSAGTFDEALARDAEIVAKGGAEVRVLVEPNVRKPGTWKYLGFEDLPETALEKAGGEDLPWK